MSSSTSAMGCWALAGSAPASIAALFVILHDAVGTQGIAIRTGCEVVGTEQDGARRRLLCQSGASAPFDLVIDALGARSPLVPAGRALSYGALWASLPWRPGFDPAALQQRYRRASVMAGVMPIGASQAAFFWSLRADRIAAWRDRGLAPWKDEVRALWLATAPLLDTITDLGQLAFARYAHRTLPRPTALALIHLGDAWLYQPTARPGREHGAARRLCVGDRSAG